MENIKELALQGTVQGLDPFEQQSGRDQSKFSKGFRRERSRFVGTPYMNMIWACSKLADWKRHRYISLEKARANLASAYSLTVMVFWSLCYVTCLGSKDREDGFVCEHTMGGLWGLRRCVAGESACLLMVYVRSSSYRGLTIKQNSGDSPT